MKRKLAVMMLAFISIIVFSKGNTIGYEIKETEITKNREIPIEVIRSAMKLQEGNEYSTEEMLEDYNKIKSLKYVDEVSIYPKLYNGGIKLNVEIKEVKNVKEILVSEGIIPMSERDEVDKSLIVNAIEIYGNLYVAKNKILSSIPIKPGSYFSKTKVLKGQKNIINLGFFRNVNPEVFKHGDGVTIRYTLVENPIITGVRIKGNTVYSKEELMREIKTTPGEIYNISTLREDKDRILAKYRGEGYILADFKNIGLNENYELEFDLKEGVIRDIELRKMVTKQKGARRRASDTMLKTREYVVRRELDIKTGEVYNLNKFQSSNRALMRLGHFKSIKPEYRDIPGDPDGKEIVLLIDENRTATLQGAISYGSEVGLMGTLSIKDTNWKGKGQELGLTYEKSDDDYSKFSIDFRDPWIKGTDRISWGWSVYKSQYEDDESTLFNEIDTYGIKFNIGKGLNRNVRVGVGTKLEYVMEEADEDYQGPEDDEDNYGVFSIFPSITFDDRNSYLNPTEGKYGKIQLETGYATGNESDIFSNVTFEGRTYHRGLWKKNTFAYRAIIGMMSDGTKESQRYRVGGAGSLRGYEGSYYRGREKMTVTIENRTQINDVFGIALFTDIGRAWNQDPKDPKYKRKDRDEDNFPSDLGIGAGIGFRLNTPLGPLRFDFGWPVGSSDDSGLEFYFNMGHSF